MTESPKERKRRGRPPLPMPEPLPDGVTPEELARAIMQGPPKKRWRYLEDAHDGSNNTPPIPDAPDSARP